MSSFTSLIMAAQVGDGSKSVDKWGAVFEVTLIMFFAALLPKLIGIDPTSLNVASLWEPVLSAMIAALYTYRRARDIEVADPDV